jgi:hypothetical protein
MARPQAPQESKRMAEPRRPPARTEYWRWPLGADKVVEIIFYGVVPTEREITVLREYLALAERAKRTQPQRQEEQTE